MDSQSFANYQQAYEYCRQYHSHPDDFYGNLIQPQIIDEFEDEDIPIEDLPNSWQALMNQQPGQANENQYSELGLEPHDLEYNWGLHVGTFPNIASDFWKIQRSRQNQDEHTVDFFPMEAVSSLNEKQRQIYDLFMEKYRQVVQGTENNNQLLVNIDGEGGSGKSYLIKLLSSHLLQTAEEHGRKNPIFRVAPTGIAAHGIHGQTIHGLLKLPVKGNFQDLSSTNLSTLQNLFKEVFFLIFDEKSMIGLRVFGMIDQRLRQIRPSHREQYMGGLNCLLIGDFAQLPPVLQKPLYFADPVSNQLEIKGQNAYLAFNKTIRLEQAMRQQGDSQAAFRTALQHFREPKNITEIDWRLLSLRIANNIPEAADDFLNAVRIYSTHEAVHEWNLQRLKNLKIGDIRAPILRVEAVGTGPEHNKVSSKDIGLESMLFLAIGAKIMLLENIWPEKGLVNGAMGVIDDIVWQEGEFFFFFPFSSTLFFFLL